MPEGQTMAKGFAVLTISNLFVRILGVMYVLPLTALIGNDGNGLYGAGYQIYIFLFVLSNTGIPSAIAKMVSENRALGDYKSAHNSFLVAMKLLLVMGAISSILMMLGANWFNAFFPRTYYTIIALAPTLFFTAVMSGFRGYFQGMSVMTPTGISQIIEQIVKASSAVLLAYLILQLGGGVDVAAAGATFGTTLGAAFGAAYLTYRYYRSRSGLLRDIGDRQSSEILHTTRDLLKTIAYYAVPITLGSAVLSAGKLVDLALVQTRLRFAGYSEIEASSLYGILSTQNDRLINLPIAISTALAAAVMPGVSAANASKDKIGLLSKVTSALKVSMLIAAPSAVGLSLLGHNLIRILFPGHPQGGDVLAIGAYSVLLISIVQVLTAILQGVGRMHIPPIFLLCGVAIKWVMNYNLVANRSLNIKGAAISTLGAYSFALVADMIATRRTLNLPLPFTDIFVKPAAAALAMGAVVYEARKWLEATVGSDYLVVGASTLVGALVYGVAVIAMKGISARELTRLPGGRRAASLLYKLRIWKEEGKAPSSSGQI